jgi:putative NADH-flavin reductase
MRLAIFGGSGRTGQHLIRQALVQGDRVITLTRHPGKIDLRNLRLTISAGDIYDLAAVEQVISGADAVISVLGFATNGPINEVSRGMENILTAMQRQNVRRLVVTSGAGVDDPEDEPKFINKMMNQLFKLSAPHVYEDMLRTVTLVRASDRDWTVIRVPMLTDGAATGLVRVSYVGKGMGMRISRADLAEFILRLVQSQDLLHQAPVVSN